MKTKYLFGYEEFKKFKPILENLNNGDLIDVPGLYGTSIQVILRDIHITTTIGRKFVFPVSEFEDFCKDESNCSAEVLRALKKVYQGCVIGKTTADVTVKLDIIKQAESYELFDVANLGFFDNLDKDLATFGATGSEIWEIQNSLTDLYDTGKTDKMSPNSIQVLMKFLDTMIEFAGSKIYAFFKFISQVRLIHEPSPEMNLDSSGTNHDTKEGEKFMAFDGGTFADGNGDFLKMKDNYRKYITDINKIVFEAGNTLGLRISAAIDANNGREVIPTTRYMKFDIQDTELSIISILSVVDLKRLGHNGYVFFVVNTNDAGVDLNGTPIYTVEELIEAIEFMK